MLYADGPTVEVEIRVAAPPERVWALVSDIALPARFSNELQEVAWLDDAVAPAPGARFVGRNSHPAIGSWETTCTVAEYRPPERFAWDVDNGGVVSASWRFEVQGDGAGTLLRQWGRMGPGDSGLTPAIVARPDKEERIVAHRMDEWRRNMVANLDGIKALAEEA